MKLKDRIEQALRDESGLALSAADVQALASAVGVRFRYPQAEEPREKLSPIPVHIRWMIRADMPAVTAIERECFDDPWTLDEFIRCLQQRNAIGMVAEDRDRVVGFMVYELHQRSLQLLNLAVTEREHRREIGSQLIHKLQTKLNPDRRARITLQVREQNCGAQLFFASLGFRCTGTIADYYGTGEAAYVMELPAPGVHYSKFERSSGDDLQRKES